MRKMMMMLGALALCAPAQAALIGDFRLSGNTNNLAGGPLTLTVGSAAGSSLDATGYNFAQNDGPTITGFSNPTAFTVETSFRIDATTNYRKLIDFLNRTSDTGLYNLSGSLHFYNVTGGPTVFAPGTDYTLAFTRDAAGNNVGYVNGVQQFAFNNASLTAVGSVLRLFQDDNSVSGEASSGRVDYIRIYDTALSATEVAGLVNPGEEVTSAVPEPATWAMMIMGFGLVGGAMRRRRTSVRFA